MKNLLETANNAFLALIAAPEAIRENREWLREFYDMAKARERISELERNLEAAEASSANLTELVERLESELATLRTKAEPSIPEPDPVEVVEKFDEILVKRATRLDPPWPGDGYELTDAETARSDRAADYQFWTGNEWDGEWTPIDRCTFDSTKRYAFRRPIAKPEPQWVACTAEEARANPEVSEWSQNGAKTWLSCIDCLNCFSDLAYRTTAQLDDWLPVSRDVFAAICAREESHTIEKTSNSIYGCKVKRSTIPLGTVLG